MIELKGEKTILRTLERADCRQLWQTYQPVQPQPTEPLQPGLSSEGADKWFDEMQAQQGREQLYLGIFSLTGDLLGDIQLSQINWPMRTADLGVGIALAQDRACGYATDAARAMLRHAFDYLDLARIGASTLEMNLPAQRLLEKCGFLLEGRERQAVYLAGRRWSRLHYGLLKGELK